MAIVCAAYATQRISSLRNGMHKNCLFGTYRAAATKVFSLSITSANPATIRICMHLYAAVEIPETCVQKLFRYLTMRTARSMVLAAFVECFWPYMIVVPSPPILFAIGSNSSEGAAHG